MDPVERIKDQDIDGVQAEILYTTLGMPLFGLHDNDLSARVFACTTIGLRSSRAMIRAACTRSR